MAAPFLEIMDTPSHTVSHWAWKYQTECPLLKAVTMQQVPEDNIMGRHGK
jgi:hypothetical protein